MSEGANGRPEGGGATRPVTIVCDSSACLSRAEAAALGCDIVPMHYLVDGVRRDETYEGENGAYDALLRGGTVLGTEAVYHSAFYGEFRRLLACGSDVLCVTMSSRLSGTHRSAVEARDQLVGEGADPARVAIVDSWTTSGGLELLVRCARRELSAGTTLPEAVARLERARALQGIAFTVPKMDVLRRSGRLGAMRRAVAGKLDRFLVMELDRGGIRDVDVAHGMGATVRLLVRQVPQAARDGRIVVAHYGESDATRALADCARRTMPAAQVEVCDAGPVVSLHLGVGSVSIAWDVPRDAER